MFGEAGIGAVEWWKELPAEQNIHVSPRRLEMALNVFNKGGDIRFVIPEPEINVTQLKARIDSGSIEQKLAYLMTATQEECKRNFSNINFTNDAIHFILGDPAYIEKFLPYVQKDVISNKVVEDDGKYMETIIENGPAGTIVPVLATLLTAETCKRPTRGKIKDFANLRGLDLTSENSFREAIDQALKAVGGSQADRFAAMHGTLQNYNSQAALETYELTIEFFCKLMSVTKEDSLRNTRNPYYQVMTNVLHRMDDSCRELYDTDVDTIYQRLRETSLASMGEDRLEKCDTILMFYMSERPKPKSEG